jgi:hypothetical protein
MRIPRPCRRSHGIAIIRAHNPGHTPTWYDVVFIHSSGSPTTATIFNIRSRKNTHRQETGDPEGKKQESRTWPIRLQTGRPARRKGADTMVCDPTVRHDSTKQLATTGSKQQLSLAGGDLVQRGQRNRRTVELGKGGIRISCLYLAGSTCREVNLCIRINLTWPLLRCFSSSSYPFIGFPPIQQDDTRCMSRIRIGGEFDGKMIEFETNMVSDGADGQCSREGGMSEL